MFQTMSGGYNTSSPRSPHALSKVGITSPQAILFTAVGKINVVTTCTLWYILVINLGMRLGVHGIDCSIMFV